MADLRVRATVCRRSWLEHSRVFEKVGLIAKLGDARAAAALSRLVAHLGARGIDVMVDKVSVDGTPEHAADTVDRATLATQCEAAIILGGDGTFLNAARSLAGSGIRLLGINLGRLGFLTDIVPEDLETTIDAVLDGNHVEEERFLLSAKVIRDGACELKVSAFNDVVAHAWRIARLLEFETYVDDHLVNRQRADGIIVSTPTGSTAYSLSSGGPILHPAIDGLVLVPVCPHTLTTRPLVVQADSLIEIVILGERQPESQLTCDGQTTMKLMGGDRIKICKQSETVKLIHPNSYDFYSTLRTKLYWGRDHR